MWQEVYPREANATGKHDLAYRTCPCKLLRNSNGKVILHVGFRSVNAHGRTGKSDDLFELPFHHAL